MSKKTKPKPGDPEQLELDFAKKRAELETAIDAFALAASNMAGRFGPNEEVDKGVAGLRKTVRRLVGILVDQSGLPFHAAWVMAYHELHARTGFHAVAEGEPEGGAFLDNVAKAGKLPELVGAVSEMLRSPEYARRKAQNP
jgi:hypothetical protein